MVRLDEMKLAVCTLSRLHSTEMLIEYKRRDGGGGSVQLFAAKYIIVCPVVVHALVLIIRVDVLFHTADIKFKKNVYTAFFFLNNLKPTIKIRV